MAKVLNYGIAKSRMRVIGDGDTLGHGVKLYAAPYLPIIDFDEQNKIGVVIKKGTFVTFDEFGYLVPAKKVAGTLTYTQTDVENGVYDIDSFTGNLNSDAKVSAPKTSTKTVGPGGDIEAYYPIGVAMYDIFQYSTDPWFKPQDRVALVQDGLILLALDSAHESQSYTPGCLLTLDDGGFPVPVDTIPADSSSADIKPLSWVIGRLVKVIDLAVDKEWTNALEVVVVPDIAQPYMAGKHTDGVSDGFDATTKKGLLIQLNTF